MAVIARSEATQRSHALAEMMRLPRSFSAHNYGLPRFACKDRRPSVYDGIATLPAFARNDTWHTSTNRLIAAGNDEAGNSVFLEEIVKNRQICTEKLLKAFFLD